MYEFRRKPHAEFGINDNKMVNFGANGVIKTDDKEVAKVLTGV